MIGLKAMTVLLGVVLSIWRLSTGDEPKEQKQLSDKELLAAIEAAVKKDVSPEKVEGIVGVRAALNTRRKYEWGHFRFLSFLFEDPKQPLDLRDMKDVVFWLRPIERGGNGASIVGIAWTKAETLIFFKATAFRSGF